MARRKADGTADASMGSPPVEERHAPGLPAQSDTNVWPILSEPDRAAEEIAAGKHDTCLVLLEHIAKSQSITVVFAAAGARRRLLTET